MNDKLPYTSWLILLSGVLFTCLLSGFLWLYTRQSIRREQSVSEKHALEMQLMHAQKMETMGLLVTGITHDFNNILGSLMGFNDLARLHKRKTAQDPKLEDFLVMVGTSASRGKELIDKMLRFSREKPSHIEPIFLHSAVENTLALIGPLMPSRIRIEFFADNGLPAVMADSVGLGQALANLLINARDAIEGEGKIKLDLSYCEFNAAHCSACKGPFSGDYVQLSVSDTGTGMSAEVQRDIFEPFYSTKEADKGTGMGLAILQSIVHLYNGHIIVASRPGQGTSFLLLFPVPRRRA
jgi:two-component system cell cycle sensor histidine kinase/response regulator CckA